MTITTTLVASAVCGYLCGSLPFGYWAGKLRGIDIRQHGSGNIGATNVIRVLGKPIGIPVFLLDMLKGWLPVTLARSWMSGVDASPQMLSTAAVIAGFCAVLGHMFTFWLQFKGGKGIATTAGVLLGISAAGFIGGWIAWLVVFFATKYVSLASIAAALAVPSSMALMMWREQRWDGVLLGFGIVVMILAIVKHRANIQRLLAGTENRAGAKKAS
ncbi:MAG: glycerol-3-phosphate 1-O-acyltransferase PlsY [Verrucomicrobiaceae bacterium]|nr:glycerol-3-phosphate 1-O-acyltransferase PlsY [Verrucomicrobiaceae bacterium]